MRGADPPTEVDSERGSRGAAAPDVGLQLHAHHIPPPGPHVEVQPVATRSLGPRRVLRDDAIPPQNWPLTKFLRFDSWVQSSSSTSSWPPVTRSPSATWTARTTAS